MFIRHTVSNYFLGVYALNEIYSTHDTLEINLFGTPNGIRTRVVAVKGRCLNRLTMGAIGHFGEHMPER